VWLQPRYDAGCGFSPPKMHLQELSVDSISVCSEHSQCRWAPLHRKLVVGPDMTKILAVVTPRKASLSSI
jgi:hypothetical protein